MRSRRNGPACDPCSPSPSRAPAGALGSCSDCRSFGLRQLHCPFAAGTLDAAWCLGVLCTTDDQAGLLAELRRVLRPDGRLGLLVFTAVTDDLSNQPQGNNFPTPDALRALLRGAGLQIEAMAPSAAFRADPPDWTERVQAVDAEIDRRHHADEAWRTAQHQSSTFGLLLAHSQVASTLVVARAT